MSSNVPYSRLRMAVLWIVACTFPVEAADWPTYRHDNARSGVSPEQLTLPLHPAWVYRSLRPPAPSWPKDQWNEAKATFDVANHAIATQGLVFVPSSADGTVTALEADTGATRWTFCGGAAVRVAPAYREGKLYVGADDGWVRCLDAREGNEIWAARVAPQDTRVIGHGKVISLWPVRTGVLVDAGVAYVAAGLFPAEGVYIHALDADTGRPIWTNDSSGSAYTQHPHPGCDGFSGVPPQGPMVVDRDRLFIPAGRSVPAAFAKDSGELLYWQHAESWQGAALKFGGAALSLLDGALVASPGNPSVSAYATAYDPETGKVVMRFREKQAVATLDTYFLLSTSGIRAVERKAFRGEMDLQVEINGLESWYKKRTPHEETKLSDLRGHLARHRKGEAGAKWRLDSEGLHTMVLADTTLFAGGVGRVIAVDTHSGTQTWEGAVEGVVGGLAVANGYLFVSTDTGSIHCFGTRKVECVEQTVTAVQKPFPPDDVSLRYDVEADELLRLSGVRKGYCVVLSGGNGRLAHQLAERSELRVLCLTANAAETVALRRVLSRTSVYGTRLTVDHPSSGSRSWPVPDLCANLIVHDISVAFAAGPATMQEISRILRPCGGTVLVRREGEPTPGIEVLEAWARGSTGVVLERAGENGRWLRAVRGALPGTADWSHQYGSAAATACSEDQLAHGPFELLWFGEPGPTKSIKGSVSPLVVDGRLLIARSPLQAYDAYNGTPLWESAIRDASFVAAGGDSLYVTRQNGSECTRVSAASGETTGTFRLPESASLGTADLWGILAVEGDTVFGTALSQFRLESADAPLKEDFAQLAITRKLTQARGRVALHSSPHWLIRQMDTWLEELEGGPGEAIPPDRLAVYKGRILRQLAGVSSRSLHALERTSGTPRWVFVPGPGRYICHASVAIGDGNVFVVEGREAPDGKTTKHLVALDAETGTRLWATDVDLTTYCKPGPILHRPPHRVLVDSAECLSLAYRDGVVVLGEVWGGQNLFALSAADGALLWSHPVRYNYYYRRRSMVVGQAVYTDRFAYDLHSGKPLQRKHPITGEMGNWTYNRSYGCGGSSASARALFFRSSVLSYFDLDSDQGITNFGGVRPGCWINVIPANGLLVAPDQTRGCTCPYPIKASLALRPSARERHWSFISLSGPPTPVKHLAVNLGAPGDRRDETGKLWFGYPRPFHPRGFRFSLDCEFNEGMGFYRGAPDGHPFEGGLAWVYSSGCTGLRKLSIPLQAKGSAPGRFDVVLHFASPAPAVARTRVFDVVVQSNVVCSRLTLAGQAGSSQSGRRHVLKGVVASDLLTVELRPDSTAMTAASAPVLNGVEVTRVSPLNSRSDTADVLEERPLARWTWSGPDPLQNRVKPGTCDAVARGGAIARDGRVVVTDGGTIGKPAGVKDDSFVEFGKITELSGATAFAWTFAGLRFDRPRNHIVAGSIENGFGPGSLFFVSAQANPTLGAGTVSLVLWGIDSDGKTAAKANTPFPGLDLVPGAVWDLQVLYDASRGPHANVGCRVRREGMDWGAIRWRGNPVMALNPAYTESVKAQAVYLGKYSPASTLASALSVGEVTLRCGKDVVP
ncbi:MAG: PQQ-binding-like beta-propeller repeat protein [Lentisphaerae bacterium]|nr:PQQ-binding-like beta-propeller repeat protein [Lentisphaerota bacterium]MBT4821329.1 PQQ-binding-like beta-propeller repeat protein [Lentisphaerota bacterium]MBT5610437.1 PQQ-binding-like beta-propeller repeat protein [Lentisphaerota bacterium]MBT7061028.1 PQQ-binding-like beta-propeller repeat protein [Lentisphaerota bacterium]MBT7842187.1 PQQ-binding-like beta-propeller repeat protein [Lentisphaerota bacterium]